MKKLDPEDVAARFTAVLMIVSGIILFAIMFHVIGPLFIVIVITILTLGSFPYLFTWVWNKYIATEDEE